MGLHPGTSRGTDYMRGFTWGLKGEDVVMHNLNNEISKITARSMKGLIMAAAHIRNETETKPPLTPVDTGNLRSSYFVVTSTSTPVGSGSHNFKGDKAAEMSADHKSMISEAKTIVEELSVGKKAVLMMGYTANYAGFVHEMIGATFNPDKRKGTAKRRAGAGAKWFETAIKNNKEKIVQIIQNNAQLNK